LLAIVAVNGAAAAARYATVESLWACAATPLFIVDAPVKVRFAPAPVMEVPGETPTSPVTVVIGAVNVTDEPPRIAKLAAVPRSPRATVAAVAFWCRNVTAAATTRAILREDRIFIQLIYITTLFVSIS
jgi:hypothetical protein